MRWNGRRGKGRRRRTSGGGGGEGEEGEGGWGRAMVGWMVTSPQTRKAKTKKTQNCII